MIVLQMPRIWLDYCEFLDKQGLITRTRQTFDRALRSLPITQHSRVWEAYLRFAQKCGVFETCKKIYKRYLKFAPRKVEEYIDYLLSGNHVDEAVRVMYDAINSEEGFQSMRGKTVFQLWAEMSDLICDNPTEIKSVDVEKILRAGTRQFKDEVGKLWNAIAKYYILLGNFEKASYTCVFHLSLLSLINRRETFMKRQ